MNNNKKNTNCRNKPLETEKVKKMYSRNNLFGSLNSDSRNFVRIKTFPVLVRDLEKLVKL